MKTKIFKNFRTLLMISLFGFLFFTLTQSAQAGTTPATVTASGTPFSTLYFTPQIEIPNSGISGKTALGSINADGVVISNLLGIYISAIYKYGLSVAGILAAIVMMAGGIMWLASGGDSGQVSKAKSFIGGSLVGLFLLFGTYIILNTVNPDLLKLDGIKTVTTVIEKEAEVVCCEEKTGKTSFFVQKIGNKSFIMVGGSAKEEFVSCEKLNAGSMCLGVCVPVRSTSGGSSNVVASRYECWKSAKERFFGHEKICCTCKFSGSNFSCFSDVTIDECNNLCAKEAEKQKAAGKSVSNPSVMNWPEAYYECDKDNPKTPKIGSLCREI